MIKITQNFYQVKVKNAVHRLLWVFALLLMATQVSAQTQLVTLGYIGGGTSSTTSWPTSFTGGTVVYAAGTSSGAFSCLYSGSNIACTPLTSTSNITISLTTDDIYNVQIEAVNNGSSADATKKISYEYSTTATFAGGANIIQFANGMLANNSTANCPGTIFTTATAGAGMKYIKITANNNVRIGRIIVYKKDGLTAPVLTPAVGVTVDAPFNVTFAPNSAWEGAAGTVVTVGGTTLTGGYAISSGVITFTPSASVPTTALRTPGTKAIVITKTGYAPTASINQTIGVGADAKLVITQQPTAPASNGAVLATQPIVVIQDQYNNVTNSTANVVATASGGTWTLNGTTSKAATSGTVTYAGLTATSVATVPSATITFNSGVLTAVTSNSFNIPNPAPPVLTAAVSATVDAPFNVTFTDNPASQAWISTGGTVVTVGGTTLAAAGYTISNGVITFTPSASALLYTAGTKAIVITKTGYAPTISINQTIGVGADTKLVITQQPTAPASNGAVLATQPTVVIQDQYNNVTNSIANVVATASGGTWTLNGTTSKAATSGTVTYAGLTAASAAEVTGATIIFTSGSLTVTSGIFNIPAPPAALTGTATATAFTTIYGTPSASQSFTVGGTNLTANITATAPTGFEVSNDNSTYGATATFVPAAGTVDGSLYVRLKAAAAASTSLYDSKNITLASTGATTVNITTAASGNTVSKKDITIDVSGLTSGNKTYDGNTTATLNGTATYLDLANGENYTVTKPLATFNDANAADGIPVTVADFAVPSANYTVTQPTMSLTANINKALLTVTANNQTVTYSTDPATVITAGDKTITGFVIGENSSVLGGSVSYTTSYTDTTDASTPGVTITPAGLSAANYDITYVSGTITVNKADSSIVVTGSTSYDYDGGSHGPTTSTVLGSTGTVSYLYSGTGLTDYDPSSVLPINAGTYKVVATVAADTNYNAATSLAFNFDIAGSSAVTLTADTTDNTVDNNIDITFTENPTWRGAVTDVRIGTESLSAADYDLTTAGILTLKPSATSNALLRTPGTKTVVVSATGYADATVSQIILAGADAKLVITQQPTAPATNGAVLVQQPIVVIQDQYNNITNSTATVTATVGAGAWTPGGNISANGSAGTATFSGLTATSDAALTDATITFTSGGLTAVTSNSFNIPNPAPPALTAVLGATVDAPFDITFTDTVASQAWVSAGGTSVTVSGIPLTAGYAISNGKITFTPSASAPAALLQTAGTKAIVITKTGYTATSFLLQTIGVGADAKLVMYAQPAAPSANGGELAAQPVVFIQDQYGNVTHSTATVTASASGGTWALNGTTSKDAISGTVVYSGLTATSDAAVAGATITFSSGSLTAVTSDAFTIPNPAPPVLTAATGVTVDAPFDVVFTDNAASQAWVSTGGTSVIVNGTTLSTGYVISDGKITFTPSASALLQTAGTKAIVITKTGYAPTISINQTIGVGAAAQLAITTQPATTGNNGNNGTALIMTTQPVVKIQDLYGNTTTSTATVVASVGTGTWTLGGTNSVSAINGTVTYTSLTAKSSALVTNATITFTSGSLSVTSGAFNIPAPVGETKTWDIGNNDKNLWPVAAAVSTNRTVDGLDLIAGGSSFGQVQAESGTFTDGYTAPNHLTTNGGSTVSGNLPSTRFLRFPVTGPCVIKLWVGATATTRKLSVSDGTTVYGTITSAGTAIPYPQILTVNYTGVGGNIYIYADASVYVFKISYTYPPSSPTLVADTDNNTVDNAIDITFEDDDTWRTAVTAVKIGATNLTEGTDYVLTAGNLQLKPSATSNALLRTSGTKAVSITATGYANATVSQVINAGVPTKLGITQQPTAPATNGAVLALQPIVAIQDQYGNTTTSTAVVVATAGGGTWTLGGGATSVNGNAGVATYSGLTATSATAVSGAIITFSSGSLTTITSSPFNIPIPLPPGVNKIAVASTGWSTSTTWSPPSVPAAGETVLIPSGITVSLSTGSTGASTINLIVGNGGTYNGSSALTLGSLTVDAGGTVNSSAVTTLSGDLIVNGSMTCSGTSSNNGVVYASGSNGNFTIGAGATFSTSSNLILLGTGVATINGSVTTSTGISSSRVFTFPGNFTIGANGSWSDVNGSSNTYTFGGNFTNNGTFAAGGSTSSACTFTKANIIVKNLTLPSYQTFTIAGTTTMDGGSIIVNKTLAGAFTLSLTNGAVLSYSGTSAIAPTLTAAVGTTINYTAAGGQTVVAMAYANLGLSGSGAKTITAGTSVTENLSITGATASVGATLNISVNSLTLGGKGKINGTWGSTNSSPLATNTNNTFFTAAATGYITVQNDTRLQSTIDTLPTASNITYGQTLASSVLSGGVGSVVGSFAFTTPTLVPSAGTASQNITLTPTNIGDYKTSTATVDVTVVTASQTITFNALPAKTYGDGAFTVTASSPTSGINPITYASSDDTVATVNSTTGLVTILKAGSTNITASQAASDNYNAASVAQSLTVNKASQTIIFDSLANRTVGDAQFALGATSATSDINPITYTISVNPSVATISGGTVTIVGEGTVTITASQAEDDNYTAAENVSRTLTVTPDARATIWTTSWSTGAPTAFKDAVIEGNYSTQNGTFIAKNLTVTSGVLTVYTGTNLTVVNKVTNTAGATALVVENNANLVQINDVANSGPITVNRDSNSLYRLDYTMWSSPVTGTQRLYDFSPMTSTNRFYVYNPLIVDPLVSPYETILNTAHFTAGKGYLIRMPNSDPATNYNAGTGSLTYHGVFKGTPNNGNVTITGLTAGKYNAIGNPYPSTLKADDFLNQTDGTLYFYRKTNGSTGSSYATYTLAGGAGTSAGDSGFFPNGKIQVGQGFIVTPKGTTLNFTNAMRVANNDNQFYKTKNIVEKNRVWLNLTNTTGAFSQALVGYMTNATQDVDAGFDGKYINDSKVALTSNINNQEYTIQARALPFDPSDIVPLNFKTDVAGDYTIAIDHTDGLFAAGQDVYLVDSVTGAETDLQAGGYTFTAPAGTANARFSLKYQKTLGVNAPTFNENSVIVYKDKGIVYVKSGNTALANVKVYDIQGKLLVELKDLKSTSATINALKDVQEVLVVKVTAQDNTIVTKKIIN